MYLIRRICKRCGHTFKYESGAFFPGFLRLGFCSADCFGEYAEDICAADA